MQYPKHVLRAWIYSRGKYIWELWEHRIEIFILERSFSIQSSLFRMEIYLRVSHREIILRWSLLTRLSIDASCFIRICIVKLFKMTIFETNFATPLLLRDNELINGHGTNIWTLDFTITEHWLALIFDTTVCTKVCINGTGHLVSRLCYHVYVFYVNTRSIGILSVRASRSLTKVN